MEEMNLKKSLICTLLMAVLLLTCLTACEPKISYEGITHASAVVSSVEELAQYEIYPDLQELDLTGSPLSYQQIAQWAKSHPNLAVHYTIPFAGKDLPHDVTELTLEDGSYAYSELLEILEYLPDVTSISLPHTSLNAAELEEIRQRYSRIAVDYSVDVLGQEYDMSTTMLDLSAMEPDQMDSVIAKLDLLPEIQSVELMAGDGSSKLNTVEVKALMDAMPGVAVNYSFDLFGQRVSTTDEVIAYEDIPIGNGGEAQIRQALDILQSCTYFKLDGCGVDNEIMAQIRDDYPNIKVVWRIYLKHFNMLTDTEMLRVTHHLNNDNCDVLKYCTDVVYADFGHNEYLSDISFMAGMTKLECVILAGAAVYDLSVFANMPNLEWLELCFCGYVKDLTPLKGLPNLKYLNLSFTAVNDLTAVMDLPLERFQTMGCTVPWEQQIKIVEKHPDAIILFEGKQPFGYGWRYNDQGYTRFEYYSNMRIIFRYDEKDYFGNNKNMDG